ncbi:MAG: HDOD domain-containing protein [Steroidobacteraceae bacterium]
MSKQQKGNIAGPSNKDAFAFVQALALELSAGKIDIPSFPDVAVRVRKVLADENADATKVARVVGSEPALAAKLLQIANSAAVNPRGQRVEELRTAIARLGLSMVRGASIAFAMEQLKQAPALAPLRKPLNELWERSVKVAAMAYVVARSWSKVNPDTALLAGLMHGMGRVYILTRAVNHPRLFADSAAYQQIVMDWHNPIAKAVLESWEISPEIIHAVEHYTDLDRENPGPADLTDVLTTADLFVSFHNDAAALEIHMKEVQAIARLGLDVTTCQKVLQETAGELASLRSALTG